jgi:hypothetical protein
MYPVCEDFDRQSILIDLDPASQDIFDEYESPNEED